MALVSGQIMSHLTGTGKDVLPWIKDQYDWRTGAVVPNKRWGKKFKPRTPALQCLTFLYKTGESCNLGTMAKYVLCFSRSVRLPTFSDL